MAEQKPMTTENTPTPSHPQPRPPAPPPSQPAPDSDQGDNVGGRRPPNTPKV